MLVSLTLVSMELTQAEKSRHRNLVFAFAVQWESYSARPPMTPQIASQATQIKKTNNKRVKTNKSTVVVAQFI